MPPVRKLPARLETDPKKALELVVGLPEVRVLGVCTWGGQLELHIETCAVTVGCPTCGVPAQFKGWREVVLVDLPGFGTPTKLHWHKRRWRCADPDCTNGSWTEQDYRIAAPRMKLTDRAGRWVTKQVGRADRTVNEVAEDLGCDWHTVNDAVLAYGQALVDHPGRFGEVEALGLDEVAFVRTAPYRVTQFSTSIVDVAHGQLLDVVPGRGGAEPAAWILSQGPEWRRGVRYGTLDLSGAYKSVFDTVLPGATQVADPFHVVKVRHEAPCIRRRVRDPPLRAVAAVR
jgi:transposase